MPNSNSVMIHKLQHAINDRGGNILYNTTQFYSQQQERPVTLYIIKQAQWNEERQRTQNIELFSSTSQIQIVLFLRDFWYRMNGWEVPTDNPVWEEAKAAYKKRHENS